jgi:hypothetical protein
VASKTGLGNVVSIAPLAKMDLKKITDMTDSFDIPWGLVYYHPNNNPKKF